MPAVNYIRYALDPTGENPDNKVNGEIKTLSNTQIRAACTVYGPFYTESFVAYDHGTNRLLVRGVDYDLVDLVEEATLLYGEEIMQTILVRNPQVSNQIRYSYQVLGGLYQNNSEGIAAIYNSIMTDNRPVDYINVTNKPSRFPPTAHLHLLSDVVGFGPVVVALEDIRDAVVMSNIPAFEALIDWVKTYASSSVMVDPAVFQLKKNDVQSFDIRTSNKPNGTIFYWTIRHHGTANNNFLSVSGNMTLFQNRTNFTVTLSDTPPLTNQTFDIEIRSGSVDGPILTLVEGIIYVGEDPTTIDNGQSMTSILNACCIYNPKLQINAESYYIKGDHL